MRLYFNDSKNKNKLVCKVNSNLSKEEKNSKCYEAMNEFYKRRNCEMPYVRKWCCVEDGIDKTLFDIGSHSEHFWADENLWIDK